MFINKKKIEQLLWLLPFLTFTFGYLFISYSFKSKTIKAPHFIGSSLHRAMTHASKKNIRLHIITEKEHAHIEPGTILEQKPQPGAALKEKQSVYIITARSPQQKNTPSIVNRTTKELKKICEKQRVKHKNYSIPSTSIPETCIAQIPAPNNPIKENKIISYIAQKQSPFFILPDFSNLTLEDVIALLKEQDISYSVYQKTTKLRQPYPKDATVANQKPLVGSFIKLNKSTHLQLQIY